MDLELTSFVYEGKNLQNDDNLFPSVVHVKDVRTIRDRLFTGSSIDLKDEIALYTI